MENIENKNTMKERLINEFLDKYFSNQRENEKIEAETIEIKREELEKLIEDGESVEDLLYKTNEKGYIFHGSPCELKELIPKKGKSTSKKEINEQEAVYATNQPSVAIFHAVMPHHEIKGKFIKTWHGHGQISNGKITNIFTIFEMNKDAHDDFLKNPHDGYVYLLKQSNFKQVDSFQFVYKEKCTPSYKIPVKKEDFKHEIKITENKYPQPLV